MRRRITITSLAFFALTDGPPGTCDYLLGRTPVPPLALIPRPRTQERARSESQTLVTDPWTGFSGGSRKTLAVCKTLESPESVLPKSAEAVQDTGLRTRTW